MVGYTGSYQAGDPFQRRGTTDTAGTSTMRTPSTTTSRGASDKDGFGNVTHLIDYKKSQPNDALSVLHVQGTRTEPFGGFVTEAEFKELAKHGCGWCSSDVDFYEAGVQVYKSQDTVLCPSCAGGDTEKPISRVYTDRIAL